MEFSDVIKNRRSIRSYKPNPVPSPNWCQNDIGIAIEHMVLTAWDLGLGTCWMGQSNREDLLRELLEIPEKMRPVALITVGEAKSIPDAKTRKNMETIASWGKYGKRA